MRGRGRGVRSWGSKEKGSDGEGEGEGRRRRGEGGGGTEEGPQLKFVMRLLARAPGCRSPWHQQAIV